MYHWEAHFIEHYYPLKLRINHFIYFHFKHNFTSIPRIIWTLTFLKTVKMTYGH